MKKPENLVIQRKLFNFAQELHVVQNPKTKRFYYVYIQNSPKLS